VNHVGGETQQTSLNHSSGYSKKPNAKKNPAYLEPISQSLQKPIEGLPVLALSATNTMLKNQERNKSNNLTRTGSAHTKQGLKSKIAHRKPKTTQTAVHTTLEETK
jgi:hypothetical protein